MSATWGCLSVMGLCALLLAAGRAAWLLAFALRTYCTLWGGRPRAVSSLLRASGDWAVVTGASEGIGKAYAIELARQGLSVVLISRTRHKLVKVAEEIETGLGVKTKVIVTDFTGGVEIYPQISSEIEHLTIGVLVNNVGMTFHEYGGHFLNTPAIDKRIVKLLNCNILSVTMMASIVLPKMVARNKGVIINISSGMAAHPFPLLTMYTSSKIFTDYFSRALHAEYKDRGIIVQSVLPFLVSTAMTQWRQPGFFIRKPDQFVQEALRTVGLTERTHGCLAHGLQGWLISWIPAWILSSKYALRKAVSIMRLHKHKL